MPTDKLDPLAEIRRRARMRYLTVKPEGFVLEPGGPIVRTVQAEILGHGGARTFYRARKPECRSLNGINAIRDEEMLCCECYLAKHCVPQVRIDLLIDRAPFLLLLSHTSARRFLEYLDHLKARGLEPDDFPTDMHVINRGKWGEVAFALAT